MKKIYEKEILNTWINDNEDEDLVNKRFEKLNEIMTPMYEFILAYSNYYFIKRDYGTGEKLTMIEAHILTDIFDYKGITVTELSQKWNRTTSAISQIVKKLIKAEYIIRINNEKDGKIFHLNTTKKGDEIVFAHKKYDNIDIVKTRKKLLKKFSLEEIIAFDKICKEYTLLLNTKNKKVID